MEREIHNQVEDLPSFARELAKYRKFRHLDPSRMIFTGSGDSFASSLFVHYLSQTEAVVTDPYELQLYPHAANDKTVFITSVSGKTRTNIQLAKRIKRSTEKRVAITANPDSPLAKECDEVIRLRYRNTGVLTSGTASFSASLLAAASLIRQLPKLDSLRIIEKRAAEWAQTLQIIPNARFLLVGSGIDYSLSMYGAFKIHEVLGLSAQYQQTEQLGHSQLFSLRQKTDNLVFLALGSDEKTREEFRVLSKSGFHAQLIKSGIRDTILSSLHATFCLQHLALGLARKIGLRECAFLTDNKMLALSSQLIY